ncbi:spexin isoform X4 [Muntiacus reevesi]
MLYLKGAQRRSPNSQRLTLPEAAAVLLAFLQKPQEGGFFTPEPPGKLSGGPSTNCWPAALMLVLMKKTLCSQPGIGWAMSGKGRERKVLSGFRLTALLWKNKTKTTLQEVNGRDGDKELE